VSIPSLIQNKIDERILACILKLFCNLKVLTNGTTQAFQILLSENLLNPGAKSSVFKKLLLNLSIKNSKSIKCVMLVRSK